MNNNDLNGYIRIFNINYDPEVNKKKRERA